jgi:hypothetical protein
MRYDVIANGIVICTLPTTDAIESLRAIGRVPEGASVVAVPSWDDIRAEAYRRLRAIHDADDDAHMAVIVGDDARERLAIMDIPEASRTPEQATRLAELRSKDAAIEAVWASYNAFTEPLADDYDDAAHWEAKD